MWLWDIEEIADGLLRAGEEVGPRRKARWSDACILALLLNVQCLTSRTWRASADYSRPSWCPEPAGNLDPLLRRGEGGSTTGREGRGPRLLAQPAAGAACAYVLGGKQSEDQQGPR